MCQILFREFFFFPYPTESHTYWSSQMHPKSGQPPCPVKPNISQEGPLLGQYCLCLPVCVTSSGPLFPALPPCI